MLTMQLVCAPHPLNIVGGGGIIIHGVCFGGALLTHQDLGERIQSDINKLVYLQKI